MSWIPLIVIVVILIVLNVYARNTNWPHRCRGCDR